MIVYRHLSTVKGQAIDFTNLSRARLLIVHHQRQAPQAMISPIAPQKTRGGTSTSVPLEGKRTYPMGNFQNRKVTKSPEIDHAAIGGRGEIS